MTKNNFSDANKFASIIGQLYTVGVSFYLNSQKYGTPPHKPSNFIFASDNAQNGDVIRKLDSTLKNQMESAFDADFSNVEIITGPTADELNRNAGSTALTYCNKIYFTAGNYTPDTAEGISLLAHELQHVKQIQSGVRFVYREDFSMAEMEAELVESQLKDNIDDLSGLNNLSSTNDPLNINKYYFSNNTNNIGEINRLAKRRDTINNSESLLQKQLEPNIDLRLPSGEIIELTKDKYNELITKFIDAIHEWLEQEKLIRSDEAYEELVMKYFKWLRKKV